MRVRIVEQEARQAIRDLHAIADAMPAQCRATVIGPILRLHETLCRLAYELAPGGAQRAGSAPAAADGGEGVADAE